MKSLVRSFKAVALAVLFVLLPTAIVIVLLLITVSEVRVVGQTIVEKLVGEGSTVHFTTAFAVLIVLAISFLLGLLVNSRRGQVAVRRIEQTLLFRIPGYVAIRTTSRILVNANGERLARCALVTIREGVDCFAFVTNDYGHGRLTLFIPGYRNLGSSSVQLALKGLVRVLKLRVRRFSLAPSQPGMGARL
jgi:uncharacterized membrane protein